MGADSEREGVPPHSAATAWAADWNLKGAGLADRPVQRNGRARLIAGEAPVHPR